MTTPVRRQYLGVKRQHQDEILLFRMGDFYETFDDDARVISRELEIALTSREFGKGQRVPLAGIPYHALESYLAKLIKKGYKVAICEQTSDPATSRGIVDREVVRVVTPGTVIEDSLLDQKANNYLAALVVEGESAGLAYVDITTSEFATSEFGAAQLPVELARLAPSEVLAPESQDDDAAIVDEGAMLTRVSDEAFHPDWARETLLNHFGVASLEGFGCERLPLAARAAGAILDYLNQTQRGATGQIATLYTYSTSEYMVLDQQTRRNLELYEGGRWGATNSSLFTALDFTKTPMGGRLLRRWLGQPLLDVARLTRRQDAVEWFHRSSLRRERVALLLDAVSDMERLVNKARGGSATPRDPGEPGGQPGGGAQDSGDTARGRGRGAGGLDSGRHRGQRRGGGACAAGDKRRPAGRGGRGQGCARGVLARPGQSSPRHAGRPGLHRKPRATRAQSHGHPLAQSGLQQGVRLLHRG